ncbi:MAG: UDP-N-acetylmuramoyl-L-alanyl-D-glutamate--2,6-diaminopimelate ligase [Longimonas sp.]|uniref:UDP-N-acetylmuramoyl-L-alanyl-D-glutamate--2, 6-diaminopimelate ligase n=1 Tax=Longimonas sp. TaxID=2039626 RepID=UPI00335D1863
MGLSESDIRSTVPPASRTVRFDTLLDRLYAAGVVTDVVHGDQVDAGATCSLAQVADDSRKVREGACFVAIPGNAADGHAYIEMAINHGAHVVVAERLPESPSTQYPGVRFVQVSNARIALGHSAAAYYEDPARELSMIGITGTNGKTTTAYLTYNGLQDVGETPGLISTVEVRTRTLAVNAALTTPGPIELQRTLRRMVDDGCTACVMEVSSHALDQYRTTPIGYDVALFTNLSTDHIDYHGTPAAYQATKKRLFDGLSADATAIYNRDDDAGPAMVADTAATVRSYGTHPQADIAMRRVDAQARGLSMRLDGHDATFQVTGRFNAYNLAAAYGALRACGADADAACRALESAPSVPGRFERLDLEAGPTVIVDYAHTPHALESILQTLRPLVPDTGALWCVFGCGGDRDTGKRRLMGGMAETLADRVIVTNDNPRTEDPYAILNDIRRGMSRPADAWWIPDRAAAIEEAARRTSPYDVVLIAGKGHETYQIIGDERHAFDDRVVARRHFEAYHTSGQPDLFD